MTSLSTRILLYVIATMLISGHVAIATDLSGVVIGVDGRPVAGESVVLSSKLRMSMTVTKLGQTTTDDAGQFRITVPDQWFGSPQRWRQPLALTVATEAKGSGGVQVYSELPLPRHRLTIQLGKWTERKITLLTADDKPLAGAKVQLTGWQLPMIYPARYSQTAARQMTSIEQESLKSTGKTGDDGTVSLLMPPIESVAAIEAEIEPNVFVNWSVASSNTSVPKNWSEKLTVPKTRRLPIKVEFKDGDGSAMQVTVTAMPLASYGATTTVRHTVNFNGDYKVSAVIQDASILTLREVAKDPSIRHLIPAYQDSTGLEAFNVTVSKGIKVTGRAVFAKNQPAIGIRLAAMMNWHRFELAVDSEGRFEFNAPAGQMLLIPLERCGYRPQNLTPESATVIPDGKETYDLGDVQFTRLKTLTGVVRDDAGKPVGGAMVEVSWPEPVLFQPDSVISREERITTNADGAFSVIDIDPNADVTLVATHDGATTDRVMSLKSEMLDKTIDVTISKAAAVSVSGRVVDQSGNGIADLAVILRHRMQPHILEPLLPVGEDVTGFALVTDKDGRFTTPQTLPPYGEYIAVIHIGEKRQAISGWKNAVAGKPLELPPIDDSRTSEISGRVLTTDGKPLSQARVVLLTSSGQATAVSAADGSFQLERPPGRMPLLIAEADGYVANGVEVDETDKSLELRLPAFPVSPTRDAPPQTPSPSSPTWTTEQKQQLAIKLFEAAKFSNQNVSAQVEARIARNMPDYVLKKLDTVPATNQMTGQMIRFGLALGLCQDRPEEGLRLLDEFPDAPMKSHFLLQFESVAKLDDADRLQLLARIVQDGRGIKDAEHRVMGFGQAGERLLDLGQKESGASLLREGLEDAKKLSPAAFSGYARGAFAEELAQIDTDAALELIEPLTDTFEFNRHLQNIAHELAAIDPDRTIAMLDKFRKPDPNRRPIIGERDSAIQRVCYRMIRIAPDKAIPLARTVESESVRAYCFELMTESLLRQDNVPSADRKLARQLHDEAWKILTDNFKGKDLSEVAWFYPSTIAGMLLHRTAELAPDQLPHRTWQAIALRRPMLASGAYQPAGQGCVCELALLLNDINPDRALQVAEWLPSAEFGSGEFATFAQYCRSSMSMLATLHTDQCEAALDSLKDAATNERFRTTLIKALIITGPSRDRAIRSELLLWYPDDEDTGPME